MKFLWFLLGLTDWLWCFLMPLIATVRLASRIYRKDNEDEPHLFTHWCYYWILFVLCYMIIGFVSSFSSDIGTLLTILRIVTMSVVVNPRSYLLLKLTKEIKHNVIYLIKITKEYGKEILYHVVGLILIIILLPIIKKEIQKSRR